MPAQYLRVSPYADDEMNLPVADVESAVPFYETVMGFRLVETIDQPQKKAILERDQIKMAIVENGGDPSQEGCFFEVDNVEEAFTELKSNGLENEQADFRVDQHGETAYKVFFVIAPDGLCYCLGQRQD